MRLHEVNKYLREYGCWWFDPWWEQERWFKGVKLSQSLFLEEIQFLKSIFTESWVKSLGDDPLQHPFLQMVHFGQGLSQISSLFSLAERLQFIVEIEGYKPVLDSYKSLQEARSADLEIFMASVLGQSYTSVSFIRARPKKGRTPDILVSANESDFVVECKTVSDSQAEKWVGNYNRYFSRLMFSALPDNIALIYRPLTAEIDPTEYGDPHNSSYQIAASVDAYPIIEYLRNFREKPEYIDMGVRGELIISPKYEGLSSSIETPSISREFVGRRLVKNAIMKANRQISDYAKPGIAAISYGYPPQAGELKLKLTEMFEQYSEEYQYLMGVLIFPAQNILEYIPPIWVTNPSSICSPTSFGIPKVFEGSLGIYSGI